MKIIVGLFLGMLLIGFVSASAQMSRGTIENSMTDEENKGCEFISMQDGVDTPMRFAMTFPSTPNVKPQIHGTDSKTEFSSDFNNEGFFFSTNATDIFTIRLDIDYDNVSNLPRVFLYELFTGDNALNQAGNWNLVGNHFCKIIEFNAKPAPHIKTDDEIIETVANYQKEQYDIIQKKQDETNNMIAIIVVAGASGSIIVIIILIMMKLSKSRDTANSMLVSKQFGKTVQRFEKVVEFMTKGYDYHDAKIEGIGKKVDQGFRDIMITVFNHMDNEKKLAFPHIRPAYIATKDDVISVGMGMFDKPKSVITKALGFGKKELPKEKTVYDIWNEKTTDELYQKADEMQKEVSKYYTDETFKELYDVVMKLIRERIKK